MPSPTSSPVGCAQGEGGDVGDYNVGEDGVVEKIVQKPKALDPQMLEKVNTMLRSTELPLCCCTCNGYFIKLHFCITFSMMIDAHGIIASSTTYLHQLGLNRTSHNSQFTLHTSQQLPFTLCATLGHMPECMPALLADAC